MYNLTLVENKIQVLDEHHILIFFDYHPIGTNVVDQDHLSDLQENFFLMGCLDDPIVKRKYLYLTPSLTVGPDKNSGFVVTD